jgi:diguanylate cyclase (GGDEF)-like protein/PAS domain S-box-containing protein
MNELFGSLLVLLFFIALIAFVIVARDILAHRQSQKTVVELSEQLRLQIAALNAAANAIVISDRDGNCIWVNPAFTVLTGYEPEEILGQKLSKLKSGVQEDKFYQDLWKTILGGSVWHGEIINKNKQGVLYMEEMTISPVPNDKGEITHFIAIKLDVTERKRMQISLEDANRRLVFQMGEIEALQEKLREQALRDPLTNLYNRRFLEETLDREIAHARRDGENLCVAMIDIDNFKLFNDRYGHKVGDMILRSLGDILIANTRKGDVACRYGGEEFIVVMPGADVDNALKRAKHWRKAFQLLQQSFNGQELQSTVSIGVAVFPDHGVDGDAVIQAADKAMYESKARGKNCVTIFDAGLIEQK